MLRLDRGRVPFVKAEYNLRLRRVLNDRSKAAVEYKFQNISAGLLHGGC